jgi:hypothetical protein
MASKSALFAAFVCGTIAVSSASAKADEISAERAAAIQKCNAQADQRYPVSGDIEFGRERNDWYRACMAEAGQEP